jgi:hypothetical protein
MTRVVLTIAILASALIPAVAQKIETQTSDRTRIVHLKTALNHLTVIEVAEPVVQVAAGSPLFKVEWRENKVFVQPTEAEAATNLFIWTATQRLNYELEPAGSIDSMDFAVDQAPVQKAEPLKPTSATIAIPAQPSLADLLLQGSPVRLQPSKQRAAHQPVEVWIRDLYQRDDQVVIRYAVRNHSDQPYSLTTPLVYQLNEVRLPQSLYGFVNSQLGDEQAAKLKRKHETPVQVLDGQLGQRQIAPGQEAVGVVTLQLAASTEPTVLRFQFPNLDQSATNIGDKQRARIAAFLVR